ncbi:MAG: prepilin-type N-terminal cleavage/methylation domain-containing protein [Blautia wexlerae]|nr:prepilin-type N-terminal cleavage/methylation domain-containing protein [Blautia wexlerae]
MFKFLKDRKKKDNKGFTLVELVIVVAILAILVGILAPQYTKYVEKSRKAADVANLENMVTAFKTAASDGNDQINAGVYTITIGTQEEGTTATNSTTVKSEKLTGSAAEATVNTKIVELLASYAGKEWTKTKLKSSKWETSATTTTMSKTISAKLTVNNDGSIDVEYIPTNMKEQAGK